MTKADIESKERFIKALRDFVKAKSGNTIDDVAMSKLTRYLVREENRLQYMADMACNDEHYCKRFVNGEDLARTKEEKLVRAYINKVCGMDMPLYFCDDPRGMQIRFEIKCPETNLFSNNFDCETSGVNSI